MGVAMKKNVPRLHRWKRVQIEMVSMGGVDQAVCRRDYRVIRKDRKFQNHLVYLCITVSANAEDPVFPLI